MRIQFKTAQFEKEMRNIVEYSSGFLTGVQKGKTKFLDSVGQLTINALKEFIDSMARVNPEAMHHVYEWNQTGSPSARLFDISYTVSGLGLSLKSTFRQSTSVKAGSTVPFYNKASIMENGIPVRIVPTKKVLAFTDENGEEFFTRNPVTVNNPGGEAVRGSYETAFDTFINQYFSQAFLRSSGILDYIKDVSLYKKNLRAGKSMGRTKGVDTGYRWITNIGVVK
jgi:hypothetical protein